MKENGLWGTLPRIKKKSIAPLLSATVFFFFLKRKFCTQMFLFEYRFVVVFFVVAVVF